MRKLFGTDGIRGVANAFPMTADMALKVGMAIAHTCRKKGHTPRIVIGKDTRISSYMIEYALVSGVCSAGADALIVGVMPTPGVAFLTQSMRADAGIVISASHNPYEDNGIKVFAKSGFKLADEREAEVEDLIFSEQLIPIASTPHKLGKAYRIDDARGRYVVFVKNTFPSDLTLEGMKIVLDCANGATYKVAPEVFFELGAEVIRQIALSLRVGHFQAEVPVECRDRQHALGARNALAVGPFVGWAGRLWRAGVEGENVGILEIGEAERRQCFIERVSCFLLFRR